MIYSASFTASGILYNEFESILPFIGSKNRNELLEKEVQQNNHLKINSESARKRIVTEIKKRIDTVDNTFWNNYRALDVDNKKLMLLYLCVKTYMLVQDFHFKVTATRFWSYQKQIDSNQYKMYLDELASREISVDKWAESTKKKCITNYIRMLKEAGLTNNNQLQKPQTSNSFFCYFLKHTEPWALDIFLLNNQEKETIINYCK